MLRKMSKRAKMIFRGKIREGANMIGLVVTVDTDGIVTKTKTSRIGPETGSVDGAASVAIGIGDSDRILID